MRIKINVQKESEECCRKNNKFKSLLDKAINEYCCLEFPQEPFLIMSSETIAGLISNDGIKYTMNVNNGGFYKGYKIAINEFIPFGEVEIR